MMFAGPAGASWPVVLVVEDEAALATMLRYNLEKQGFRVEEAVDGQEALTRIAEAVPDIVLLDWMLPVMSGIEVCRQIRRRPATRDLPVIMVTARTEDQDAVRGLVCLYGLSPVPQREAANRIVNQPIASLHRNNQKETPCTTSLQPTRQRSISKTGVQEGPSSCSPAGP